MRHILHTHVHTHTHQTPPNTLQRRIGFISTIPPGITSTSPPARGLKRCICTCGCRQRCRCRHRSMHCMSVPRCGSLAPVLTTLALPCLTYDNMILGLSLISLLVMKPDSLANLENAMAGRQPDSHSNKEDAVAARARWTPDLHNSSLFVSRSDFTSCAVASASPGRR